MQVRPASIPRSCTGTALPDQLIDHWPLWEQRYRAIRDLEAHLHRNGTKIVKIFLHLPKDEQAQRFRARIDAPGKSWKFSLADIHERSYWDTYQQVYGDCLQATSTEHAPWYIVPADESVRWPKGADRASRLADVNADDYLGAGADC